MQLNVRSIPFDLFPTAQDLCAQINRQSFAWRHADDYLFGFGQALRYDIAGCAPQNHATHQVAADNRFALADIWWKELSAQSNIDDRAGVSGSGLIAFGSFSFTAQSSAGSALIVPRLLLGRRSGKTWLTQIWRDGENTPEIPISGAGLIQQIERIKHDDPCLRTPNAQPAAKFTAPQTPRLPKFKTSQKKKFLPAPTPQKMQITPLPSEKIWMEQVAKASSLIQKGELNKVVLSRSIELNFPNPLSLPAFIDHLHRKYRDTWVFAIDGIVGASPEMLAQTDFSNDPANRIHCRVLAGTKPLRTTLAPLTSTNSHTAAAHTEFDLETSEKDISEHRIAVDSAVSVLSEFGALEIGAPYILRLPNVEHFATDIYTTLAPEHSLFTVIAKLHPTAALGGSPREKALAVIARLESHDRERYGAPVGWISQGESGNCGQWAIALRCCGLSPHLHSATAWAGGGIMGDSISERELAETRAKFAPILNALSAQFPKYSDQLHSC
ncbi:isochorismate synthase [Arcanobacterium hippocoleae]|uniref:Menaquinone-specific isochorismate synthase n=1 Tax=Arcanobacterium hippocoleae TaxID=149017 RepID=A0ABU1T1Q6_9ACTO|nr:menaquinone-specific isochorismate synthase [Arcanobacterium hippocoleae]